MTPADKDYLAALIEDMDDRFDLILDHLLTLQDLSSELRGVSRSLARLEHALGTEQH